jgi:aminomethyltransferase
MKRTPLYNAHQRLGARLIEFGGWEMPVHYTSIMDEHQAVRSSAGLFDISHMGEVQVSGPSSEAFLNQTLTNDCRKLAIGQGQYTLMCNENGGVIDDLYVYRLAQEEYLLIINASRIEPDLAWLEKQLTKLDQARGVSLRNESEQFGAVALQGPKTGEFINSCFPGPAIGGTMVAHMTDLRKNQVAEVQFGNARNWVSRTGYTGEDGFEVVTPADCIESVWNKILEAGRNYGIKPAGLGARDTLRTEACYPLYGQELNESITPMEGGLGVFVSLEKGEFNGRSILAGQKANGVARKLIAFKMKDKSAPPRPHYRIWSTQPPQAKIGEVTSGTQSPTMGIGIGMGYVPPDASSPGTPIEIEIRANRAAALIVKKPIYRKPG